MKLYAGIDLHSNNSVVVVLDENDREVYRKRLPNDLTWRHIFGAGLLGGIGFTMSIFITNLAFAEQAAIINASKMAILVASLAAGTLGYGWLRLCSR